MPLIETHVLVPYHLIQYNTQFQIQQHFSFGPNYILHQNKYLFTEPDHLLFTQPKHMLFTQPKHMYLYSAKTHASLLSQNTCLFTQPKHMLLYSAKTHSSYPIWNKYFFTEPEHLLLYWIKTHVWNQIKYLSSMVCCVFWIFSSFSHNSSSFIVSSVSIWLFCSIHDCCSFNCSFSTCKLKI